MDLTMYLIFYFSVSVIITYLLVRTLAFSRPLPDRRKKDRRTTLRPGHVDRRAAYRYLAEKESNKSKAPEYIQDGFDYVCK